MTGASILVVEDDEATAELERRVLTRSGMKATVVGRVADALALLPEQTFAAILLDYNLPDGDPWAIVLAAEAKQPRIPVVLVTAQGSEQIASEAIQRGVADYVVKSDTFWDRLPGIVDRVTGLARAEENLRASEFKANAILDAIPDLVFRVTGEGVYLDYRAPRAGELVVPGDQIIGRNLRDVLPRQLADEALEHVHRALDTGSIEHWEYQLELPDPQLGTQDFEARISPCGADEVIAIVRNVTAAKSAERSTLASLREKEVLLQEIHHRVKNNLQVVQSLLSLQQRALGDSAARAALQDTARRVQAMALVHENLYQSGDLTAISLPQYATDLLAQIGEAHAVDARGIELRAEIADLRAGLDSAVPFGLLLAELVSNSLKHAFNGRPGGTVWVRLAHQADGDLLTVADDGVGFAPGFELGAERVSMGLQLASGLARQLGGELFTRTQGGANTGALLTQL